MSKKKFQKKIEGVRKSLADNIVHIMSKNHKKPLNPKQLAAAMGIRDNDGKQYIQSALVELIKNGKLEEIDRGKFKLKQLSSQVEGRIEITRTGSAYVITPDYVKDIYIPPKFVYNALNDDTVKVRVYERAKSRKLEGEIMEVIQRARMEFVGVIEISPKFAFLIPDSPKMHVDIYIPLQNLNGAKNGQKVVAKITDWPKTATSPFGEVTEVLGFPGESVAEMNSILAEHGFPLDFPESVKQAADKIPVEISQKEIESRWDYRDVCTFTIDPFDAKDFDDALSIQKLKNGNWEIGVHIADVTHYVKPNSIIENEAVKRATSIYLVDRVIPMLPEVLSNNVCSLRPNEEKLTYACIFEMDDNAAVKSYKIGRTIINSNRRFTYEEVQEIIENGKGELYDEISVLNDFAKQIRKRRIQKGAIAFDKIEVRFKLDEDLNPIDVILKSSKDAHKLIEEFMLLANRTVAEHIGKVQKGQSKRTFVYRIHDNPDPEKLKDFVGFINKFGYKFKAVKTEQISSAMNALIEEIKGKKEENVIEQLAIRTMAKAEYSTENIGHYGLAFDYYSHFTSPIRRYPDMMVHRLLSIYLSGGASASEEMYKDLCKHSSEMERKAAEAERDSTKYFQVLYMQKSVGKEFNGVVTGVTEWGIFIEITENKCEGMVRLKDLDDDYYYFDEKNYRILGHNSDRIIRLGDDLRIRVKKADLVAKRLDFEIVD
jgi:ribonuclease R